MKYLCLIYVDRDRLDDAPADECLAYADMLRERGQCLAAEALRTAPGATTLRSANGKVQITDGPFAEAKEVLAGFYLLDVPELDEAVRLASKIPPLAFGRVEIRPVVERAG